MPDSDDALLARLNALRKSPISLSQTASIDVPSTPQRSTDSDLAARFRSLTPGSAISTSHQDPEDTPHNDEDDRTIEELLHDLGPEEQWTVQRDEGERIRDLMDEAKNALPTTEAKESEQKELDVEVTVARPEDEEEEHEEEQDKRDETEADDYVQRVLAELDMDKKYGTLDQEEQANEEKDEADEQDTGGAGDNELALPSAPTELPSSPAREPDIDEAMSARFASLSLPAAPSFNPSKKPVNIQKSVPKSNLPTYTDEDMESWCCICNDDATVKCLGCDGDLYCSECWAEGHGNGAGQERGHRALAYTRDGPAAAA